MSHCLSQRSDNMCVWKKRQARSQRNAATVLHLWPLKSRAGNLNWQTSCWFQLGQLGGGALDSVAQQRHPVTRTKHDSNMRDYFLFLLFQMYKAAAFLSTLTAARQNSHFGSNSSSQATASSVFTEGSHKKSAQSANTVDENTSEVHCAWHALPQRIKQLQKKPTHTQWIPLIVCLSGLKGSRI